MERFPVCENEPKFNDNLLLYKGAIFQIAFETQTKATEVGQPFEDMIDFIYCQLKQNPNKQDIYHSIINYRFTPPNAVLIYISLLHKSLGI